MDRHFRKNDSRRVLKWTDFRFPFISSQRFGTILTLRGISAGPLLDLKDPTLYSFSFNNRPNISLLTLNMMFSTA
jgi:hypothetical protein